MKLESVTNRFLGQLPRAQRERLLAHCEGVDLAQGEVLARPGEPIAHVYFPVTSSIARVIETGESSLGVALIGNEGMLGASLLLGIGNSPARAVVQGTGLAFRLGEARFRGLLAEEGALRGAGNRYLFVLFAQLARTSGCTRFHVLEQRLARWLLMSADRACSSTFHLTHEFLAHTLGVRRVGITRAATSLQARGLIRYSRGEIMVLDRKGLVRAACTCYAADLASYRRVLR
jgi:CRP-like cAMP-binding protein